MFCRICARLSLSNHNKKKDADEEMTVSELTKQLEDELFDPYFKDVVTLDPSRTDDAWDKLTENVTMQHLGEWRKILLFSFISTLDKNGLLDGKKEQSSEE